MTHSIAVAAVQLNSRGALDENLRTCERLVAEAASSGAQVVLLPENFAYFGNEGRRRDVAESLHGEGPILSSLRRAATNSGVSVVGGGLPEASEDPLRPYNTCVVVDAAGAIVGAYRKIHLFDVNLPDGARFEESATTKPGARVVVLTIGGVPMGLSICYDLRFPELYRDLTRAGAEVVLVPSAFTQRTGRDHWHVLLRARAIENQIYVVGANQWGNHSGDRVSFGHTLIADPWGTVVNERESGTGVVVARVDLEALARVRRGLPCLSHMALR